MPAAVLTCWRYSFPIPLCRLQAVHTACRLNLWHSLQPTPFLPSQPISVPCFVPAVSPLGSCHRGHPGLPDPSLFHPSNARWQKIWPFLLGILSGLLIAVRTKSKVPKQPTNKILHNLIHTELSVRSPPTPDHRAVSHRCL